MVRKGDVEMVKGEWVEEGRMQGRLTDSMKLKRGVSMLCGE